MKKELEYFYIEDSYGRNQEWFTDFMMNRGGCGALTACDTCLYLHLHQGKKHLYPFQEEELKKEQYIQFGELMRPYLSPRKRGIDTLDLFMDGFRNYLRDIQDEEILMKGFSGIHEMKEAKEKVREQMEEGFPIPYLNLLHQNPIFEDYEWHWFLLTGYEEKEGKFLVKAVTYGKSEWLDFEELWNSGHDEKGGMVLLTFRK